MLLSDIIQGCRLLANGAQEVTFQFVARQCNEVAHKLSVMNESRRVKVIRWLCMPVVSHLVVMNNRY